MNNEVLRRKMFNTVLRDRNQPAGILASSSELAGAVQRRAAGGLQDRRKIAGQQFMRQFAGMPEGSRKPESYLQVLNRIKGLPYNQQVEELTKAGYGATIGPDAPDFLSQTGAAAKQRIGADIEQTKQTLGKVLAPGADKPVLDAIQSGIQSIKYATGLDYPVGEEGGLGSIPTTVTEEQKLKQMADAEATAAMDESVAAQQAGARGVTPQNVILGEYGSVPEAPAPTVAETVSETAVSGEGTQTRTTPRPATSAAQPVDLDPENTLANFNTQLDGAKTSSEVANIKAPKIKAEDFVGKPEEVGESWTKFIDKSFQPSDRVTFSDMEEKAKELMDFDPEAGDKERKSAFFMNLMKAGLAVAAGESDNLVTNLAKGLGVGLEGYGKDLNRISADEKAQRKEYRATVMKMVDDENDYRVAMDGLKSQMQLGLARLAQADENAARGRNLQRETAELGAATTEAQMELQADVANARNDVAAAANALQFSTLQLAHLKAVTDLGYKEATLTEQQRSNTANEAINMYKAELSSLPKEHLQVMALGKDYILLNEDGSFKGFTEQGETLYKNLITASTKTKASVTDLMQTANGHAINGNILGVPLSTEPTLAQSQALVWESTFNDPYSKALEDGNTELAQQVLSDFASSISGQAQPAQETATGFKVKR